MEIVPQHYTHGGRPWSFWKEAGQFFYLLVKMHDDSDLAAMAAGQWIKIGITTCPKSRLKAHRADLGPVTWLEIVWLDNSAEFVEKLLAEVLNPWRMPGKKDWFQLSDEVENWLIEGTRNKWEKVTRGHRIFGYNIEAAVLQLGMQHPASWLTKRIRKMYHG